ncbi:hypothetical protein L873DRAFT_1821965, partial [Choiromyces venosus 120613-1]
MTPIKKKPTGNIKALYMQSHKPSTKQLDTIEAPKSHATSTTHCGSFLSLCHLSKIPMSI